MSRFTSVAALLDYDERTAPAAEYVAEYNEDGDSLSTRYFNAWDGAGTRNHEDARLLTTAGWRMRATVSRLLVIRARESVRR